MSIIDQPDSQINREQEQPATDRVKVFISYAHRDEDFRLELNDHLSNLQRQGLIADWHDRQIKPGQNWADEIDQALNEAKIILLLVSARFMASDYCYAKEMLRAIKRHDAGEAVVVPIILSACDWQGAPFSKLQALPNDAKPIKGWADRDEAWLDVVRGLRKVIENLPRTKPSAEALNELGKKLASEMELSGGALPAQMREQVKHQIEEEKLRHGQSSEARARNAHLEEVMHWINFNRLQDFLSHGERHYTKDGFAALCILQQSELMGGHWALKRIQSWLKNEGKQPKEIHLQPVHDEAADAAMISSRLANAFQVNPGAQPGDVSALTKKICKSLHQDRRLLITIQPCDEFSEDTWHWMLQDFWCSLLEEFRKIPNPRRVRLLVVLLTDLPLVSDAVVAHCCEADAATFDPAKLARLPLDLWTDLELLDWLTEYWGENRTAQDLEELTRKIFLASNQGQPPLIYSLCKKRLVREVGS